MYKAIVLTITLLLISCNKAEKKVEETNEEKKEISGYNPEFDSLRYSGEIHFRNIKQLTFGGNNAEAYWSFDNKQVIFQSDWDKINSQGCDQQFVMNVDGSQLSDGTQYKMVSTGKGRTTCGYFLPDGRIIYSSTHATDEACPEQVEIKGRYVWGIFPSYDIYVANADGSNPEILIGGEGYDAEPTVSPDGKYIIFTSTRDGDLDLYRYEISTKEIIRLTDTPGYDGGAFFSRDSKKIVWRASRPRGDDEKAYFELLSKDLVEPFALQVFTADIDGSNVQQITNLPKANWAPFFHPSGEKILFCSNHGDPKGRVFAIYTIELDGENLTKISNSGIFDAFPMFSYDGKKIVFASNRRVDRKPTRETNIFVADWIENPEEVDLNFRKNQEKPEGQSAH
jgi:Tol biopolymer transport system component